MKCREQGIFEQCEAHSERETTRPPSWQTRRKPGKKFVLTSFEELGFWRRRRDRRRAPPRRRRRRRRRRNPEPGQKAAERKRQQQLKETADKDRQEKVDKAAVIAKEKAVRGWSSSSLWGRTGSQETNASSRASMPAAEVVLVVEYMNIVLQHTRARIYFFDGLPIEEVDPRVVEVDYPDASKK